MNDTDCILAIDQGTTSSRAMVFDKQFNVIASSQLEFPQFFPNEGWVEHDPEQIWISVVTVCNNALDEAKSKGYTVRAIGITNQRETSVVWDKQTGKPLYNAIVWQDRRTSEHCAKLKSQGLEATVQNKTGLLLDPYFSATKLTWILNNVEGARKKALSGELAFGTIDSWLIWKLTAGEVHATDATNAARTSLYNIHTGEWDSELLKIFDIPETLLPKVLDCSAEFGETASGLFNNVIPISGVAGDQQAASIGQACFQPGSIKSTYGTGCFVLMNTGDKVLTSQHKLLSTIAYQLDGRTSYALEGSIFVAGAAIQWLRDGLGIIQDAKQTESLASSLEHNSGVYVVPAFTGLGVPYWLPDVRGAIFGLTRATGPAQLVRATLESVCYQTHDLFKALADDGIVPNTLRVDGGMVANNWLLQFLADTLNMKVQRPKVLETTALGAAYLAGKKIGLYGDLNEFSHQWHCTAEFEPQMEAEIRQQNIQGWQNALRRVTV